MSAESGQEANYEVSLEGSSSQHTGRSTSQVFRLPQSACAHRGQISNSDTLRPFSAESEVAGTAPPLCTVAKAITFCLLILNSVTAEPMTRPTGRMTTKRHTMLPLLSATHLSMALVEQIFFYFIHEIRLILLL